MNWSLSQYNLICYGSSDDEIFCKLSGSAKFWRERLFEYTSDEHKSRYQNNIASLAELPTLVVAESNPKGEPGTPAFFSRIDQVRDLGKYIYFKFHHLSGKIRSEEVFGCGYFNVDAHLGEHSRMHWAIKEGNLIEELFTFIETRSKEDRPKFFDVASWPLPTLNHVAVMMPFAQEFDPVHNTIKAACKDLSLEALRVDEIYGPTNIMNDVFSTIVQSRLVISDLTGRNPNVLYETGLAHASNCDVILLVQSPQDIPFNLSQIRHIKYLPNEEGMATLNEELKKSLLRLRR